MAMRPCDFSRVQALCEVRFVKPLRFPSNYMQTKCKCESTADQKTFAYQQRITYIELELAFCGVIATVELRALFFSVVVTVAADVVLALLLVLLLVVDTFDDFFAGSLVLPLEADCLESLDLPVEELSITTWPAIEDNELLVCRPVDLAAAFFDVLIVGDIFSHLGFGYVKDYTSDLLQIGEFLVFLSFRCLQFFGLCCFMCAQRVQKILYIL